MTGPINHFEGLLAKYKERLDALDDERRGIIRTIKETTGIIVSEKEIEVRDHTLYLRVHSAKKQVIHFRKTDLIAALQKLPGKIILDVK